MQRDELTAARELFSRMLPLLTFVLSHGGLPPTIKDGLADVGFPVGSPRLPLTPLDKPYVAKLAELVETARGQ